MLEVREVSKMYENQRGVRHMDFSMSRGEIVGFLGPNGAGKTTTMRMITGYLNPTKGQILVDGLSMAEHPKKARRKIGYLPETPPLYPEMSVSAYLKFVADLRDIPIREQRARIGEAVEKLGLKGRERQIIKGLSKGYRQRLGLAQAILHQPDLLILDEPTSGLDPKQIIEIRQLIKELGEKHTVLLSTHILPEVNTLCNRVLIINQGQIVMDGNPNELGGQMENKFQVSLEIKGEREQILRELALLSQVEAVKLQEQSHTEAGANLETSSLLVSARDRTDIREAIFYRMAELGLPILEMKRENLSLEDIFLQLTSQDPTVVVREDGAAPQAAESDGNSTAQAADADGAESDAGKEAKTVRRTWAICRKELQMYFYSPVAYVAFAFYFLLAGFFFANDFLSSFTVDMRPLMSNMILFYLFVIPLLTMRLVSEELRQGTDELLLTSPASLTEIVMGKYLAALLVQFLLVAFSLLYPAIMGTYGSLDQPVLWLSYLSLFLLGAAMMAVGLFCSSLSSHQMIAGIAAFAMLLLLWVIDWLGYSLFSSARDIFEQFSIVQRLTNLQKGVFDLPDVLFYVTMVVMFLVLSIQVLERKRWR